MLIADKTTVSQLMYNNVSINTCFAVIIFDIYAYVMLSLFIIFIEHVKINEHMTKR